MPFVPYNKPRQSRFKALLLHVKAVALKLFGAVKGLAAKTKLKKVRLPSSLPVFSGWQIGLHHLILGSGALVCVVVLAFVFASASSANSVQGGWGIGTQPVQTSLSLTYTPSPVPTVAPSPTPVPTVDIYAPLEPGTHAEGVAFLQERLMELDYMEPDEPTDYYGSITEYAVQLFQREHNLQVDGRAGAITLNLLHSEDAKPYVVTIGNRGTDVEEYQVRLRELGYLKTKASGLFGTDTETAVKAFQKRNSLAVDGKVGANTREAFYVENVKAAPSPKPSPSKASSSGGSKKTSTPTKKPASVPVKPPNGNSASAMISFARAYLGVRYVRAGKVPEKGFDCSGFVYWCLRNNGVSLKYMTSAGWAKSSYPRIDSMSQAEPGDILCFNGHVGIYMGNGQMIDASSGQGKVRIATNIGASSYWKKNFICARRVY